MNILALETSTETGSVAWLADGITVAEVVFRRKNAHAEALAPAIEQVAALAGYKVQDLQAVALSAGPGSYTGLRIGASTAKGLCAGLGIPLYPVNTLQALAWGAHTLTRLMGGLRLAPMLDARRMEVYTALYEEDGTEINPATPVIIDESFLAEEARYGPIVLLGNGVAKVIELLAPTGRFLFMPEAEPMARFVGELAYLQIQTNVPPADVILFEPDYLKPFMGTQPPLGTGRIGLD
jgi:tRNA threonylcarbamoyladenosine biosynthesis protein TsaB